MDRIKRIRGNSGYTFFEMINGEVIIADSEFRARSGEIDGLIVYRQGIRYKDSNIGLSPQEVDELIAQCKKYELVNGDIVDWV